MEDLSELELCRRGPDLPSEAAPSRRRFFFDKLGGAASCKRRWALISCWGGFNDAELSVEVFDVPQPISFKGPFPGRRENETRIEHAITEFGG